MGDRDAPDWLHNANSPASRTASVSDRDRSVAGAIASWHTVLPGRQARWPTRQQCRSSGSPGSSAAREIAAGSVLHPRTCPRPLLQAGRRRVVGRGQRAEEWAAAADPARGEEGRRADAAESAVVRARRRPQAPTTDPSRSLTLSALLAAECAGPPVGRVTIPLAVQLAVKIRDSP